MLKYWKKIEEDMEKMGAMRKNNSDYKIIFVISEENFNIVLKNSVMGFKERFHKTIRKLSKDDKIIFYLRGKRLVGIFAVDSPAFIEKSLIFLGKDTYPIRIKIKKRGKIKYGFLTNDLIEKLEFITNKKKWGGHFQGKSFIFLTANDFKILEGALNER